MKGCFLLQRRFAYVGNELALLLKERHGIEAFCGLTFTRESYIFLKDQGTFSTLLLDEEIHDLYKNETLDLQYLQRLEADYGLPNLWPYIENDRVVRHGQLVREYPYNSPPHSHEDMLRIVQATAKRMIAFFDEEKPDFMVFYAIGAISSHFAYEIAKKRGIKTLAILPSRIGAKHTLTEEYSMFTYLPDAPITDAYRQEARSFLASFREKPRAYTDIDSVSNKAPNRARHFRFLSPIKLRASIEWQIELWRQYYHLEHKSDYTTITPWNLLIDRAKRKLRILYGSEDLYDMPVVGEKYVFFPLQLEPEMTTLLYAPWYNDQLWVAKQIAKSLPVGYKLYVKEHLAMFGYRTRHFYEELKKIPNVRLIDPHVVSFPLMQNAALITTITSTVGWEALQLKKPVITFGEVFYNALPMVRVCSTISELPFLVKAQIEHHIHDEDALIMFIAKLLATSVDVDLVDIWEKERSHRVKERRIELIPLVDLIYERASQHST